MDAKLSLRPPADNRAAVFSVSAVVSGRAQANFSPNSAVTAAAPAPNNVQANSSGSVEGTTATAPVYTPGERLGSTAEYAAGKSTYVRGNYVYAAAVGVAHVNKRSGSNVAAGANEEEEIAAAQKENLYSQVDEEDGLPEISIAPSREARAALPVVGSIVFAQVAKVTLWQVECSILAVDGHSLAEPFKGVIRAQDIREVEVDSVNILECYHTSDVVRAKVLSVADPRCYLLSTAAPDLGVLFAQAEEGGQLRPVTTKLMRCDLSGRLHRRKVAIPTISTNVQKL